VIKLINWLTKIIIQTMLIAGLTVYLTWITVHTYVDKLLTKYHLDSAESKINFSDFLSQMSASLNILKPSSSANNQASEKTSGLVEDVEPTEEPSRQTLADPVPTDIPSAGNSESPTKSASPKPTATPAEANSEGVDAAPDDSVSVWKQTSDASKEEASKSDKQKELIMSAEEFTKKKDQIDEADKVKIFTLLATRLPQTEFQQLSTYVEDGVTETEWVDIQKIVEQYLKPEEYQELQDLLANY
jgi:hypothetical protein